MGAGPKCRIASCSFVANHPDILPVMRLVYLCLIAPVILCAADDPYAAQLFQKHCASCHESAAGANGRIPQVSTLKSMTPLAILKTIESGIMKAQAAPLSGDERQKIANFIGTAVTAER